MDLVEGGDVRRLFSDSELLELAAAEEEHVRVTRVGGSDKREDRGADGQKRSKTGLPEGQTTIIGDDNGLQRTTDNKVFARNDIINN